MILMRTAGFKTFVTYIGCPKCDQKANVLSKRFQEWLCFAHVFCFLVYSASFLVPRFSCALLMWKLNKHTTTWILEQIIHLPEAVCGSDPPRFHRWAMPGRWNFSQDAWKAVSRDARHLVRSFPERLVDSIAVMYHKHMPKNDTPIHP